MNTILDARLAEVDRLAADLERLASDLEPRAAEFVQKYADRLPHHASDPGRTFVRDLLVSSLLIPWWKSGGVVDDHVLEIAREALLRAIGEWLKGN